MECKDKNCPVHGNLKVRGRVFKGKIVRIHEKRITIEFDRFIYLKKYERYEKRRTRLHAHLPDCLKDKVKLGQIVKVGECRPISKIVHFVLFEK